MKKTMLLLIALLTFLTGCEGDYTLKEAKVVKKTSIEDKYQLTVDKNDGQYNYTVNKQNYDLVDIGSLVDVQNSWGGTNVTPSMLDSK